MRANRIGSQNATPSEEKVRQTMNKSNCTLRGKPVYRLRERTGTTVDGKPIYKNFYGANKKEAEAKRDKFVSDQQKNASKKQLFGDLAQKYCYEIMTHEDISPSTVEIYERAYRTQFLTSSLAELSVDEVTPVVLQEHLNSLKSAPSAVKAEYKFISKLVRYLTRVGTLNDVMRSVRAPKVCCSKNEIEVFSEDEMKSILSREDRFSLAHTLAFSTGLRWGELFGLRYSDFEGGAVHVKRQLSEFYRVEPDGTRVKTFSIKEPKTLNSRRVVPVPAAVLSKIEEQKNAHTKEMNELGYKTDYVFTTRKGTLVDKGNFRRSWVRHLDACGVKYRKFHACRATYCTMLCKRGVPLETASKLMGHSGISVTAEFYRFVDGTELRNAVSFLDELFTANE